MRKDETGSIHKDLEIELKHLVSSAQDFEEIWRALKKLQCAFKPGSKNKVISRYFDTADFCLYRGNITLRGRDGDHPEIPPQIGIKTHGYLTKEGIIVRDEHEYTMADFEKLDFLSITDLKARQLLNGVNEEDVKPIFETQVIRQCCYLTFEVDNKTAVFEIALDDVDYIDLAINEPIQMKKLYEFEVEFMQDESEPGICSDAVLSAMSDIVSYIKESGVNLELNKKSKGEIGFSLKGAQKEQPELKDTNNAPRINRDDLERIPLMPAANLNPKIA